MGDAKKSPRVQLPRTEKQAEWLELYIGGASYRQIGTKYGVNHQVILRSIHTQLEAARDRRTHLGDLLLDVQIARYTDLYRRCIAELDDTASGREVGKAQLISAARGALDSLTKILGLDQGVTINVHTENALDRELADLTNRMGKVLEGKVEPELPAGHDDSDS